MSLNWEEIKKFTPEETTQFVATNILRLIRELEINTGKEIDILTSVDVFDAGEFTKRLIINYRGVPNETASKRKANNKRNSEVSKRDQQSSRGSEGSVSGSESADNYSGDTKEKGSGLRFERSAYKGLKIIQGEKVEHDRKDD